MSNNIGIAPEKVRDLTDVLAGARKSRGLSQSQLAGMLGATQSHVSNVEAGKVDIRTSNLVELARLLDLEVMLVPRQWVPAVRMLMQDDHPESGFLYRLTP